MAEKKKMPQQDFYPGALADMYSRGLDINRENPWALAASAFPQAQVAKPGITMEDVVSGARNFLTPQPPPLAPAPPPLLDDQTMAELLRGLSDAPNAAAAPGVTGQMTAQGHGALNTMGGLAGTLAGIGAINPFSAIGTLAGLAGSRGLSPVPGLHIPGLNLTPPPTLNPAQGQLPMDALGLNAGQLANAIAQSSKGFNPTTSFALANVMPADLTTGLVEDAMGIAPSPGSGGNPAGVPGVGPGGITAGVSDPTATGIGVGDQGSFSGTGISPFGLGSVSGQPGVGVSAGQSDAGGAGAAGGTSGAGGGGTGGAGAGVGEAMKRGGPVKDKSKMKGGKEPRTLHEGEYVVNAKSAAAARPALDALNALGAEGQDLSKLIALARKFFEG